MFGETLSKMMLNIEILVKSNWYSIDIPSMDAVNWAYPHSEVTKKENGYMAITHAAPPQAVKEIEALYENLLKIEKSEGETASVKYLLDFFEANETNYDDYLKDITKKTSVVASLFHKNKIYLK